jgi:cGMP-dependent protein kinase
MNLNQKALFWGMNIESVKALTDLSISISGKNGDIIFDAGDEAQSFYILLKGQIIFEQRGERFRIKSPGEIIGWPALIRRTVYGATATCAADTELVKIERDPFLAILEQTPQDKAALFERLEKNLGNDLLGISDSVFNGYTRKRT